MRAVCRAGADAVQPHGAHAGPDGPSRTAIATGAAPADQFTRVQQIVQTRCVSCHAAQPTQPGFAMAPAGVRLETADLIRQQSAKIHQQTVQLKAMPLANRTNMTDEARAVIDAWFAAGAKSRTTSI